MTDGAARPPSPEATLSGTIPVPAARLIPLRDLFLGLGVAGPPLTYVFGYLLWIAPLVRDYGAAGLAVLPELDTSGLLLPGISYVLTMFLALIVAVVIGPKRLWKPPEQLRRIHLVSIEVLTWLCLLLASNALGYFAAHGRPQSLPGLWWLSLLYYSLHIVLLAMCYRRFFGLLRGRLQPPGPRHIVDPPKTDDRESTTKLRVAHAVLALVLILVNIPMALLYGAFGPNPVNVHRRVAVHLQPGSIADSVLTSPQQLCYIDHNSHRFLGYEKTTGRIVELPNSLVAAIEWLPAGAELEPGSPSGR